MKEPRVRPSRDDHDRRDDHNDREREILKFVKDLKKWREDDRKLLLNLKEFVMSAQSEIKELLAEGLAATKASNTRLASIKTWAESISASTAVLVAQIAELIAGNENDTTAEELEELKAAATEIKDAAAEGTALEESILANTAPEEGDPEPQPTPEPAPNDNPNP